MKKLWYPLLLLVGINPLFAQQSTPRILCGNDLFSRIVREKYPQLQQAFDATFEQAKNRPAAADDRAPLNVKVVVHIVWKNPEENLHDSIIQSQIAVLNEDFNRLNSDTADLRAMFVPVAGNADIHFQLAEIVRVQTNAEFAIDLFGGTILPELKATDTGGSNAWDTEKYLNIWVCKVQPTTIFGLEVGQILGVAFPPNGLANWPDQSGAPNPSEDGVVIDFRAFGRYNPNPLENPSTGGLLDLRGRTPVHEVGHYFGLRHIWGDGGLLGPNNCDQSDGVDDTPFANAQSEFDCNKDKNTCPQVEPFYNADMPDLVENYMDYSSESCMNMFTKGQVELMRNVLMGPRSGLLTTSAVTRPADDVLLSVYPNPVADKAMVSFMLKNKAEVSVRVMSIGGQVVLDIPAQPYQSGINRLPIDTQSLAKGVYFVEIRLGNGVYMQKMVKG